MIRAATITDIPALWPMAEKFWAMSPWSAVAQIHEVCTKGGLSALIEKDEAGIFVIDRDGVVQGACAFVLAPIWMCEDLTISQEMFWWVEKDGTREALALWKAGEEWAKERGAAGAAMIRLEGLRDQALDRMYRMRGYNPSEHFYVRKF